MSGGGHGSRQPRVIEKNQTQPKDQTTAMAFLISVQRNLFPTAPSSVASVAATVEAADLADQKAPLVSVVLADGGTRGTAETGSAGKLKVQRHDTKWRKKKEKARKHATDKGDKTG